MSIGRTDFPGGDKEQMAESLELITHRLSDDTIIYPGHGKNRLWDMRKHVILIFKQQIIPISGDIQP